MEKSHSGTTPEINTATRYVHVDFTEPNRGGKLIKQWMLHIKPNIMQGLYKEDENKQKYKMEISELKMERKEKWQKNIQNT